MIKFSLQKPGLGMSLAAVLLFSHSAFAADSFHVTEGNIEYWYACPDGVKADDAFRFKLPECKLKFKSVKHQKITDVKVVTATGQADAVIGTFGLLAYPVKDAE